MDAYEATRVVFSRIQTLDPDNAAKIMGLLLIQDHGEKDMIRLAFGPDSLLHSVILNTRNDLGLLPASSSPHSPSPNFLARQTSSSRLLPSPTRSSYMITNLSSPTIYGGAAGGAGDQTHMVDDFLGLQNHLSFLSDGGGDHMADEGPPSTWPWRPAASGPCVYFARGYCKNGSTCRFIHDADVAAAAALAGGMVDAAAVEQQCHELLVRSKSQRLMASAAAAAAAFPYSPTGSSMPSSPSSAKCMNLSFLQLQQHQNDNHRAAAVAAALMLGGDETHKFLGRTRSCDFAGGMVNPCSRQIYLTFPADSTFREEDVSNYFSIYGPVQDVRIPYQQKRMFGFVTFLYPETVKLILAKGNPHFVCDSRVLVKPYKEKGKVPDKKQHGDFSGCNSPTATGLDPRDPYDLQLGSRMMYGSQDAMLRRKLEEQQQAVELQQAIELQGRRFMGLHLLDLKNRSLSFSSSSTSTTTSSHVNMGTTTPSGLASQINGPPPPAASGAAVAGGEPELLPEPTVNAGADKVESDGGASPKVDINYHESCVEHNLPDSPFASPTKSILPDSFSLKPCFFEIPRFSSGHGAIGM